MNEIYHDPSLALEEFIVDWFKDTYDYQRLHTNDELERFLGLTPEQILNWLEEATIFEWEAKRLLLDKPTYSHDEFYCYTDFTE